MNFGTKLPSDSYVITYYILQNPYVGRSQLADGERGEASEGILVMRMQRLSAGSESFTRSPEM